MIRKMEILQTLSENKNQWISSKELSYCIGVSDKTIQSDIRKLKDELKDYKTVILAKQGYGYKLEFENSKLYEKYISEQNDNIKMCRNLCEEDSRVMHILFRLFNTHTFILKETLLRELFVSESRMTKDLNRVRVVLSEYELTLRVKPHFGMIIDGEEADKRRCIIHENININSLLYDEQEIVKRVSRIVVEVFTYNRYIASDIVIQNLIVHISYTIKRMNQLCFLSEKEIDNRLVEGAEYQIAKEIMSRVEIDFDMVIPNEEILSLAINIKGKRNYEHTTINKDIDGLTTSLFEEVFERYKIDLRNQVENRIALSLHIVSLIHRAKYNFSLSNEMNEDIKLNYPLGYDLAVLLAKKIEDKYDIKIVEDELGFIAVHLVKAIEDNHNLNSNKKVLIIGPYQSGETLLLRQNFLNLFSHLISKLDITNLIAISDIDLSIYDAYFTTYDDKTPLPVDAIKINYFLEPKDINTIRYALYDGDLKETSYFREELFVYFDERTTKDDILKKLCNITMETNMCDEDLLSALKRRESMGDIVYGNGIALYHPDHLLSEKTTLSVGVLKYPLEWQKNKRVRFLFIVCGSKHDEKQLPILFDKVSSIMRSKEALNQLLKTPDSQTFMNIFENY
ncbi:BglG family transcription antiterminator [Erysipelothrix larvae]|nr:BglG family transcription antiterminator [Erysipelothrix larvae]